MTIIKLIQNRKYWAGIDRPFYDSQAAVSERLQAKGFRNIVYHDRDVPLPANVNPKTCHIWTDDWDEWISAEYYGPSGEGELPATPAWILHGLEDLPSSYLGGDADMANEVIQILEPGRYWVDVFEANRIAFEAFVNVGRRDRALEIEVTESFDDGQQFVIFHTTTLRVYSVDMGLPHFTPAGPEIRSSADTVQRPDPEKDPLDKLDDIASSVGSVVKLGIVAAIGYAIFSYFANRKG